MKKLTYIIPAICLALVFTACHDVKKGKNFNQETAMDDQGVKFVTGAHEAGMTEVQAAQIAEKNSKNPRVVNFAKMMIEDHTAVGNKLDSIAKNNEVTVADSLTASHKQMLSEISKKSGADFDKAYMQMMVTDHEKVIDMFHHANENKSAALQSFAGKTLPTLNTHLDSAKAILSSLK